MSIKLGSTTIGDIYLGSTKIGEAYLGSVKVYGPSQPVLPANTIRCKFTSGYTPTMGDSQTLVDASENIWDIYKSGTDWDNLFLSITQLEEVIAANTTGVTNMGYMFMICTSLTSVPLFDTSLVTSMTYMFWGCTALTTVPLFDTISVNDMSDMFYDCYAVESGALALYQQASTQANPPTSHSNTFKNCGRDTASGAAELALIPASWGGTGA